MSNRRTTRAYSKSDEVDNTHDELSKDKHQQLAKIIKSVHADLRKRVRSGEDPDLVWSEHMADKQTLKEYAAAMHTLAVDVWSTKKAGDSHSSESPTNQPKNVIKDACRISWCRRTCIEYFDGGLDKIRAKTSRKRKFELAQRKHIIDSDDDEDMESTPSKILVTPSADEVSVDNVFSNVIRLPLKVGSSSSMLVCASDAESMNPVPGSCTDTPSEYSEVVCQPDLTDVEPPCEVPSSVHPTEISKYPTINYNKINLPMRGKIRLLDVGSCYNPFKEFSEFITIAIDISPAIESVFQCDFLSLRVCDSLQLAPDTIDTFLQCSLKSPVESLPKSCFHAVVFSLLLEYLPSPTQRWQCCRKARDLLLEDGLLLIITPDSSHQQRNAPMMRSWKGAIESLGFRRCRYVKQEHLHCIAFRRTDHSQDGDSEGEVKLEDKNYAEQIYIPQDQSEKQIITSSSLIQRQISADLLTAFHELPLNE